MMNYRPGVLSIVVIALCNFSYAKNQETKGQASLERLNKQIETYHPSSMATYKKLAEDETKNNAKLFDLYKNQCVTDELYIRGIDLNFIPALKDALIKKNFADVSSYFDKKSTMPLVALKSEIRNKDDIKDFDWQSMAQMGSSEDVIKTIASEFTKIEYVDIQIADYSVHLANRSATDLSPTQASLKTLIRINGLDKKGLRRSDDLDMDIAVQGQGTNLKIQRLTLNSGSTRVSSREPAFKEITGEDDLSKLPVFVRTEAIRRGGYALSYADMNRDGIADMLVGMRDKTTVLIGDKDGHFTEKKDSGLESLRYAKTAVFADFRNQGVQDLVVTLLDPNTAAGNSSVYYYQNDGTGKFTLKQKHFGGNELKRPMPAAVADFNGDGYLDFYVGYPGVRDFSMVLDSKPNEGKVGVQGLYLNDKKGGFTDFTEESAINKVLMVGRLYPHASLAVDFDQNRTVDLLVADDRNNLSPMYKNMGQGVFKQTAEEIGLGNRGFAMSLAAGDINNDGVTDVLMTNVNLIGNKRFASACSRHWETEAKKNEPGLRLFAGQGEGKFQDITKIAGLENMGQAAGGLTLLDYNNDGYQDIYVVNGLWSGTPKGEDMGSLFALSLYTGSGSLGHALRYHNKLNFMEILSTFVGKVAQFNPLKVNTAEKQRPSLAGRQTNRLFRNNGDGTFTEVGYLEGVDSIADGYIVGKADFNKNGHLGLILRNADPGTSDYTFPVVQRFKNNFVKNNSITLSFEGTASNRDAFGLYAIAEWGKQKSVQHLIANSGSLQEDRILHFGLEKRTSLDKLTVYWPSGKTQVLQNLKAGNHKIVEPNEISPQASQDSLRP
jgi:hypothetical protein